MEWNYKLGLQMSRNDRNRTFKHVRPVKVQISLRVRAVFDQ